MSPSPDEHDPFNTKRPKVYTLSPAQRCAFFPAYAAIRLWYTSWRLQVAPADRAAINALRPPFVIATWHTFSFTGLYVAHRLFNHVPIECLISASKAAAWEVALFERFGISVIRGSTTRRSVQALRDMLKAVQRERCLLLSPDGPAGPPLCVQPGAVALAYKAQLPIVLFAVDAAPVFRLNSWDRHHFPPPFARLRVPLHILSPAQLTADSLQAATTLTESTLRALTPPFA